MISNFYVDKAIISCKGLDLNRGFSESSEPSALIKRSMLKAAKEVILAVDSSKFDLISFVQIGFLENISTIVTDQEPSPQWLEALTAANVHCIWAK